MESSPGVILIGTGIAPLVAASHLISSGTPCTILNPDSDFFLENSELPFRPQPGNLATGSMEKVIQLLRPDFPGAIEPWSPFKSQAAGFHDPDAVHIRARTRLFLKSARSESNWERVEELYLKAQELGLQSQVLEGSTAVHRFPGYAGVPSNHFRGISISGMYDVDLVRYRNKLVEYVRERLGVEKILCSVSLSRWLDSGLMIYHDQQMKTIRAPSGIVIFCTPRMLGWMKDASRLAFPMPKGLRLWEEWLIQSKEFLDPTVIGVWEDLFAYSDYEGPPPRDRTPRSQLRVFKPSSVIHWSRSGGLPQHLPYASSETIGKLTEFCEDFLNWERFSISGMIPRVIIEWDDLAAATQIGNQKEIVFVPGSDGPLDQVVSQSLTAVSRWS